MARFQSLLVEKHPNGLDVLTLNRPERMNAISMPMCQELTDYFAGLLHDYKTRVVIMRGAGKGFCGGLDLLQQSDLTPKDGEAAGEVDPSENEVSKTLKGQRQLVEMFRKMRAAPQPIIAMVHGAACGAGFGLALAADIRLVTPQAKFNVAMFKMGTTGGDMSISYFLPRLCGNSVASELMLTGRFLHGERAVQTRLASELYPTLEEMEKGARQLAEEMLAGEHNGLRLTKECLNLAIDSPSFEAAVALEDRQQVLMVVGGDWKKRIGNFSGKSKSKL